MTRAESILEMIYEYSADIKVPSGPREQARLSTNVKRAQFAVKQRQQAPAQKAFVKSRYDIPKKGKY